jgi:hypothetical protein
VRPSRGLPRPHDRNSLLCDARSIEERRGRLIHATGTFLDQSGEVSELITTAITPGSRRARNRYHRPGAALEATDPVAIVHRGMRHP